MNIQTVSFNNLSFLNIHNPQELEIKHLRQTYNFSQLHLDDYLHKIQIPKIEESEEYVLVVLDFPYIDPPLPVPEEEQEEHHQDKTDKKPTISDVIPTPPIPIPHFPTNGEKKRKIRTGHVNFFIGKDYLVVLHDERTPQIDKIFAECQKTLHNREDLMNHGPVYLFYRIVDVLIDDSFTALQEISSSIDRIDKHLVEDQAPNVVEDISITRRNIVVFQTMMKPALSMFTDLYTGKHTQLNHGIAPWSNLVDHIRKIWDRLEDNKELIQGMSLSHESLLTAKTNEIVKVLTMFTAIMLPLTLITGLYGMNIVGLPYADNPLSLAIILLTMLLLGLVMVFVFKIKNWL